MGMVRQKKCLLNEKALIKIIQLIFQIALIDPGKTFVRVIPELSAY